MSLCFLDCEDGRRSKGEGPTNNNANNIGDVGDDVDIVNVGDMMTLVMLVMMLTSLMLVMMLTLVMLIFSMVV